MLVYKYGIAKFYIFLYMSISISIYIYTAIPWKETWKKIKYSQEIALIGELQGRAQKKGSVTTLALDNHTWAGSHTRRSFALGERPHVSEPPTAAFPSLLEDNSLGVGLHLALELRIVTLFRDQILGLPVGRCFSWIVHLSFKPTSGL